jgi:hypothetical protein
MNIVLIPSVPKALGCSRFYCHHPQTISSKKPTIPAGGVSNHPNGGPVYNFDHHVDSRWCLGCQWFDQRFVFHVAFLFYFFFFVTFYLSLFSNFSSETSSTRDVCVRSAKVQAAQWVVLGGHLCHAFRVYTFSCLVPPHACLHTTRDTQNQNLCLPPRSIVLPVGLFILSWKM